MNFDLKAVPFSRYGSYISFSDHGKQGHPVKLFLRSVHGGDVTNQIFLVTLWKDDVEVLFQTNATPSCLKLTSELGSVEIIISEDNVCRFRGTGVTLRLTAHDIKSPDNAYPFTKDSWIINLRSRYLKFAFTPLVGTMTMDAPWDVDRCSRIVAEFSPDNEANQFECVVEKFKVSWKPKDSYPDLDACREEVVQEFDTWLAHTMEVPCEYEATRKLAAYVNWVSVVNPAGHIQRPVMFMSKNWMINVWSWDNCFNAMALAKTNPKLAWDQFMILIDHQDETGAFPDGISDRVVRWNFCKPPIHGLALKWMMDRSDFFDTKRLATVYEPLCRWTNWWFDYRDDDNDGIPEYHHGNDSGWDNSTIFHRGTPIEGPDLSAFLVIQMEVLSEIATRLGKSQEAEYWKTRSEGLFDRMVSQLWSGNGFIAPKSGEHTFEPSESLILYLPVILGKRLPEAIRTTLIENLRQEGKFLTKYGFATESITSDRYEADGYWLGPIWAPSTFLLIEGLRKCGETQLAKDVAWRFCQLIKANGMAENFNALTGEGLRDKAYTWTSSVFLILANEYLPEK